MVRQGISSFEKLHPKPSLILDINLDSNISSKHIEEKIDHLRKENYDLFLNLNFDKMKNQTLNFKLSKHLSHDLEPLNNFYCLERFISSLNKMIK